MALVNIQMRWKSSPSQMLLFGNDETPHRAPIGHKQSRSAENPLGLSHKCRGQRALAPQIMYYPQSG